MAKNHLTRKTSPLPHRIALIGGSTGSIDVLISLLPALHVPLPITLVIVVHRKNTSDSTLVNLLALKTQLPVHEVEDKDPILPGHIYLAPADYHLLFEREGIFSLDDSEKVNYSRPSIDVTFESAADSFGSSVIGILLSGANADGVDGLETIQRAGGLIIVQRPETAQVAYMPQQAIQRLNVDHLMDVTELTNFINASGSAS